MTDFSHPVMLVSLQVKNREGTWVTLTGETRDWDDFPSDVATRLYNKFRGTRNHYIVPGDKSESDILHFGQSVGEATSIDSGYCIATYTPDPHRRHQMSPR